MEASSGNIHPTALPVDELLKDCDIRRTRRRGPGGQHRNKVETAIEILHRPSETRSEASERRSQEQNRQVAIRRLRVQLAIHVRTPPGSEPSALWRSRTNNKRLAISTDHDDFPTVLAEALDVLAACNTEQDAAEFLAISSSQLVKLLKREPQALQLINRQRRELGRHPLQ